MVPEVIAEFIKLVENRQILSGFPQLPALVENFFDVAFAAGGFYNFSGDRCEPLKALTAHAFGQDGNGFAAQQGGIISPAAAVVPGGRPDGLLGGGIELTGYQSRDQTSEGRTHFVRTGGKPFADDR